MTRDDLLEELLGIEPLRPLIGRLARKLGRDRTIRGIVTVPSASQATREAIGALLGKPPQTRRKVRVRLTDLEQIVVRSGAAESLVDAVTSLIGHTLRNPTAERRIRRDEWYALHLCIPSWSGVDEVVEEWIYEVCRKGVFRRAAKGDLAVGKRILRDLVQCVIHLPLAEPLPLPVFAERVLGDPHALDADRPLSRLVYRAAAKMLDLSAKETAEEKRKIWGRVGIVLDELSSTVLVLNVPAHGDGPIDHMLRTHAFTGMPCRLTFRQLRLALPEFAPGEGEMISICENPSIMAAAADALGPQCKPLICIEGQPSHAAAVLLKQLATCGVSLRYHGDLDVAGIRIATHIIETYGAHPWRMSASDYSDALSARAPSLVGKSPETPWDPELQHAMHHLQKTVMEESVVSTLLADLKKHKPDAQAK